MARDLGEKVIAPARGKQTRTSDFDRNRDGLYGGLPKARDAGAPGPKPRTSHPPADRGTQSRKSDRTGK